MILRVSFQQTSLTITMLGDELGIGGILRRATHWSKHPWWPWVVGAPSAMNSNSRSMPTAVREICHNVCIYNFEVWSSTHEICINIISIRNHVYIYIIYVNSNSNIYNLYNLYNNHVCIYVYIYIIILIWWCSSHGDWLRFSRRMALISPGTQRRTMHPRRRVASILLFFIWK